MLRIQKKKGAASMIEVIISAIIFIIATYGILTTISMMRPQSGESARKLAAAYIGKQMLDDLRGKVDGRTWDSVNSDLTVGNHNRTIGNYFVAWTVVNTSGGNLRYVNMTIDY